MATSSSSSSFPVRLWTKSGTEQPLPQTIQLSTLAGGVSELILDYGRAVGGIPFFETANVKSEDGAAALETIYSETRAGIDKGKGDGPFLLFSNAMDTYRVNSRSFKPSNEIEYVESRFAQKSQRFQKLILKSLNSSITFSSLGFRHQRPPAVPKSIFKCSNALLNKIWEDGVRTVDMCTVDAGETAEAWDVTEEGTRIAGQHWAPCRFGTRWEDKVVEFEVKIESGGASWGVHMVANGLIFCLDMATKSLAAVEGLSNTDGIFPPIPRGTWSLSELDLSGWLRVKFTASGDSVDVEIQGKKVASVTSLNLHPILGGNNNSGSIAFGGPANYTAVYRSLLVKDTQGNMLYKNNFLPEDKQRTFADFAVGTNQLACTIDGAKRDRACFSGDLFVMGRSIAYSTARLDAILGSITLLSSHQTSDGYIGNLCPIQAPLHEEADMEPPTYAFYSLSYALALIVVTKEYWMQCGDSSIVKNIWERFEKLISFAERFKDERGLIVAPPLLSMDWLPLGGPHFGASGKINLTLLDALESMSRMCDLIGAKDSFASRADDLRKSIVSHLWNEENGTLRMTDTVSPNGICQDINAYSTTLGVSPAHQNTIEILASTNQPPLAFQNLERWDRNKIISPYACGFAAEALFAQGEGLKAVKLIEKVWGEMSNPSNPNYSGGHWEAMSEDGTPVHDDTSLVHGWSTWPVFLLPKYLAGLEPLEPGWVMWKVRPVLAGLESVDVQLSTPSGDIAVSLHVKEDQGAGEVNLDVPSGTTGEFHPPLGWQISDCPANCELALGANKISIREGGKFTVKIHKVISSLPSSSLGKPGSLNSEKGTAEVVEGVESSEKVSGRKSSGLLGFFRSLLGKCG
ncbi:glycoside hydrolase family 78 protein [Stipitochalara longipes BDJ]|nr:glycoside hydrolase family 78 protein [Stipitochalara longipes BDJ]